MTKWLGMDRLRRRLLAMPRQVRAEAQRGLTESARDLVLAMKRAVPKDSGDLQEAIHFELGAVKGGQKFAALFSNAAARQLATAQQFAVTVRAGNAKVRYGHLVEFGAKPHAAGGRFKGAQHPGAPAQPFFFPTYRARKRLIKSRMRKAFKAAVAASARV